MDLSLLPPGVPLTMIPMGTNPDGSPPNFVNPTSLSPAVITVGCVFGSLATITVILRLSSFIRTNRRVGADDLLCVAALFLAHAYAGVVMSLGNSQRHSWDLPLSTIDEAYVKKIFTTGMLYGPGVWCTKMSIMILLLTLFGRETWFRVSIYVTMVLATGTHLSNIPVFAAMCAPRRKEHWDLFLLVGRCAPTSLHTVVSGVLGTFVDILILLLPLPVIFGLNLPLKKKLGVSFTFFVGGFAVIASALTLYYRVIMWLGKDISWNSGKTVICVFVETYIGIMVSCAPALVSIWRNTLSESMFYSKLRSLWSTSIGSGRGSTAKTTKSGGVYDYQSSESQSALHKSAGYQELGNAGHRDPAAVVELKHVGPKKVQHGTSNVGVANHTTNPALPPALPPASRGRYQEYM